MDINKSFQFWTNKDFGLLTRFISVEIERCGITKTSDETLNYLTNFTGCSQVNVAKALNKLIDEDYIVGNKMLINEIAKKQHKKIGDVNISNLSKKEKIEAKKNAFMERIYSNVDKNKDIYLINNSEKNINDAISILYSVVNETTKIEKLMSLSDKKLSIIIDKALTVSNNLDTVRMPVSYMFKVMFKMVGKPTTNNKKRRKNKNGKNNINKQL